MKVIWSARNRDFGLVDALGVGGACGLFVARFIPVARLPFWGCAFRKFTGWPCLGCGLTRAADRFAHLNFIGAWHANPLGTIAAALFAMAALASFAHLAFRAPLPSLEPSPREWIWVRVALVLAVIANYGYVVIQTRFPGLLG